MREQEIQRRAVCVFRRNDEIFVSEYRDSATGDLCYRPLGGFLAEGERGHDAVVREIREEMGVEIRHLRYLGTIEQVTPDVGHEMVLVYDAAFAGRMLYEAAGVESADDNPAGFRALWMSLDEFTDGPATLYPEGLLDLLTLNAGGASLGAMPRYTV